MTDEGVRITHYVDERIHDLVIHITAETGAIRRELTELQRQLNAIVEFQSQCITIAVYDNRHKSLEDRITATESTLGLRLTGLENWRANWTGRTIGIAIIGTLVVATISAVVTHLVGG